MILSGQSLFTEGLAARLRRHEDSLDLVLVGTEQEDVLERIIAARPSVVILDAGDSEATRLCPMGRLLSALPATRVIQLDPSTDDIRVVSSQHHPVVDIGQLIEMIRPSASTGGVA